MSLEFVGILICLVLIVIWIGAELVARFDVRFGSGWVRKLRRLERARVSWQARCIEEQAFYKQEPRP